MTRDYSLGEIAAYLKAELRGDPEVRITGLNTLQDSVEGQLSFLSNTKYSKYLSGSQASAVILSEKNADGYAHDCLVVVDPYLAYALISSWFDSAEPRDSFVHPSAIVDVTAKVADNVYVGPNVVIEGRAVIASGCRIDANTVIDFEHISLVFDFEGPNPLRDIQESHIPELTIHSGLKANI